jgi:glucose-6-phosphate 1-dehydrogenase
MPARRVGFKWASDNRRLVMDPLFPFKGRTPTNSAVGYETLIHDVMIGDQTLFMRADMVEQAWRIVQPVLDAWATEKAGVAQLRLWRRWTASS